MCLYLRIRLAVNIVHFGSLRLLYLSCWVLELGWQVSRFEQRVPGNVVFMAPVWSSL
jgi:hypothetical protein